MKRFFYNFSLVVSLLTTVCLIACNSGAKDESAQNNNEEASSEEIDNQQPTSVETPMAEYISGATNTKEAENEEEKPVAKSQQTKNQEASYGSRETLYISTYGANGKVWGHVTMNGKTGHGTIHDDDENSYSITVTRHGGELYGTDQNGRQYVFRL